MCSKKGVVEHLHKEFETTAVSAEMVEFLSFYIKESPYFYISILDMSPLQGVIPTCNKHRLEYYYSDIATAEYKCIENSWTFYTSKNDIYEIEKRYRALGVDYIFSPFIALKHFFKDKIDKNLALYALVQENFISIAVFENGVLLFGDHLDLETTDDAEDMILASAIDDEVDLELDDGIDLDEVDVEEAIESLEDFSDIEDLDSIEDIDEFSENKDVEEELMESDEVLQEGDAQHFNEDYQRFSLIQSSIGHYYKDEKYESRFIENIYIADGVGVSRDLKKYLEEEMFFNVYIRHIDIGIEICELAKEELGL
ncbi:hypothetical protein [Sulfurimonas sp.]